MNQLLRLSLDRSDNFRVRVPHCETDKARVEIDKLVSINILHNTSLTRVHSERIKSNQRGRDERLVLFKQGTRLRARRSNHDLRILRRRHWWRRAHLSSTNKIAQNIRVCMRLSYLALSQSWRDSQL